MQSVLNNPQAEAAIKRYVAKVSRRNEPLEAWREGPEYKAFASQFKAAITKQFMEVATLFTNHQDSRLQTNFEPLTDDQRVYLRHWVGMNIKPMHDLMDKAEVADYLRKTFNFSVKSSYLRVGIRKANTPFEVTNPAYLQALNSQADYLLTRSSIDDTTFDQLYDIISEGLSDGLTPFEVGQNIADNVDGISDYRAQLIANTETANAMGDANLAFMRENGVQEKEWVTAGPNPCPICEENEGDGPIAVSDSFSSGDDSAPAHPNCECYTDSVGVDLSSIPDSELWSGD